MYQHILLPTDGSDLSAAAIKSALQLARLLGARVTGLCVVVEPLVAGQHVRHRGVPFCLLPG